MLLCGLMSCCTLAANNQDKEQIIEYSGNKYTIHVERLNPDPEMTLLDVLQICPELMSSDGKTLTADYLLSVDEIVLSVDYEPLLDGIKACELSEVNVFVYGNVNNAMDGVTGYINLQFLEGKGLTGKAGMSGSTNGNGRLYADVANQDENVTIRAIAQTDLRYGKVDALSETSITSRNSVENAMVFVDWQATDDDQLKLKLSQGYGEQNDRYREVGSSTYNHFIRQRWGELVATYERTLNEHDADLYFETGINYTSSTLEQVGMRIALPWLIAECTIPFLNQSLWMTAGYEGAYTNLCFSGLRREQNLSSDLYLQFDFKKGPWTVSLGDRFRHNRFWDKQYYTSDRELWSYNRNDHALHASVGYKKGHHQLQAVFNRSFFNPVADDFLIYFDDKPIHDTDNKTNLAWRYEARYTYQTEQLVATGSVTHTLLSDMPTPDESLTGLGATFSWHKGAMRLTAGANVYHQHFSLEDIYDDTFFTLKLAPTLLFSNGFRLSALLLYNGQQELNNRHAHLYASVKMNKDLGRRCNLFANFHDLAGQPTDESYLMMQSFHNRALTIGMTFYPFR